MNTAPSFSRRAFTLIELLTVIAIIGILAAIIIPTIGKVRSSARDSQCASNVRQLTMAQFSWAADNKNRLPPTRFADSVEWSNPASPFFEFVAGRTGIQNDWTQIENTVFRCPSSTQTDNSLNGYGRNSHLAWRDYEQNLTQSPLLAEIEYPARGALLADWPIRNFQRYTLNSATREDNLWGRHSEKMKVAYVDGHVGAVSRAQWTTWTTGATAQAVVEFRTFLTGNSRNK